MEKITAKMNVSGAKVAIVVSRWNEAITKALLEGALDEFERHGSPEVTVVEVPGTWEMPPIIKSIIENLEVDAVVALGCVLQGQTTHAQLLAGDVGGALMSLQTSTGVPISWGILTPDNHEQAFDRAGLKVGNKGREAALAAVESISLLGQLKD
jgi:6,7-dimethyl-8-ribityllumazine synthase